MDSLADDVVTIQLDAYNTRDLERFLACYAAEVVIEDGAGKVLMRGGEAVRGFYGQLFVQSPALHCDIRQRIRVGSFVIDEEAITGVNLAGFPTEIHAAVVYRLEGRLIAHVRLLM
jgi:hypothetical protein